MFHERWKEIKRAELKNCFDSQNQESQLQERGGKKHRAVCFILQMDMSNREPWRTSVSVGVCCVCDFLQRFVAALVPELLRVELSEQSGAPTFELLTVFS